MVPVTFLTLGLLVTYNECMARSATTEFREIIIHLLIDRDGLTCGICSRRLGTRREDGNIFNGRLVEIDHIIPIQHGGGNELDNLRLVHWRCNPRGRAKMTDEQARQPRPGKCLRCGARLFGYRFLYCSDACNSVMKQRRYRERLHSSGK